MVPTYQNVWYNTLEDHNMIFTTVKTLSSINI